MASLGYLDTVLRLVGGEQVLAEARKLRQDLESLSKPIQIKVDVSQIAKAEKDVADAKGRMSASDKEAIKTADWRLKTEREQLQLIQRAEQVEQRRASSLAKAAEARMREAKQEEQDQRKMVGLQMQAQKEYDGAVNKQASGFQRAINDVSKYQQTVQAAKNESVSNLLNGVSAGLGKLGGMWGGVVSGITKFSDGLTHAGQVAATFAYRLTILTAPLDILIAKSVQFGSAFELALAKVGTQLDGSAASIDTYIAGAGTKLLSLSKEFPVAADDMAKALYFIVSSSNLTGEQALKAVEPLAKLATIGKTSAEDLSKGLTTAFSVFGDELKRFGDETAQSQHVMETFWEAVRKGKVEVADVPASFSRLAQFVKMAGGSFEDAMASWSIMSRAFTAPQASTAIENLGKAMTKPAEGAKAAWEALGITLSDAQGNIRPMMEVLGELFEKISTKTPAEARDILGELFPNIRGEQAALFFQNIQNWKDMIALRDQMVDGSDSFDAALTRMMETTDALTKRTENAFQSFSVNLFERIEPTIRGVLTGIIALLNQIGNNKGAIDLLSQIGLALAVAAPAFLVLGTALMGAGGIVTAIATLMSPAYLIGFALIWEQIAPAVGKVAEAVDRFGGGINGVLATVTEFARQMGIIRDVDAEQIFNALNIPREGGGIQAVTQFIGELKGLAPEIASLRDGILGIAQGIGMLIDNISKGQGILGGFATVIKEVGKALGILSSQGGQQGIANSVASGLDKIIGFSLMASIGSAIVNILSKINVGVQWVTAGQVNIASGIQTGLGGAGGAANASGALPVLAAATIHSYLFNQQMNDLGLLVGDSLLDRIKRAMIEGLSYFNPSIPIGIKINEMFMEWIQKVTGRTPSPASTPYAYTAEQGGRAYADQRAGEYGGRSSSQYAYEQQRAGEQANTFITGRFQTFVDNTGAALDELAAKAYGAAAALGQVGGQPGIYGAPPNGGAGFGEYARAEGLNAYYQKFFPDQVKFTADKSTQYVTNVSAASAATKKFADAAAAAAQKLTDVFRGLVRDALNPTSVTDEQVKRMDLETRLTKLQRELDQLDENRPSRRRQLQSEIEGTQKELGGLPAYQDQPDEFARRTRAVATGTDASTYGQSYLDQLKLAQSKMPNASLTEIADAFGDFSLFADMSDAEIDKMWNFDAVVDSVKRGIDRIVGEFKVMGEAVKKVLANMPTDQMEALKEALGLGANTSLTDVEGGVMGALGMGKGGAGATIGNVASGVKEEDVNKIVTLAGAMKTLDNLKETVLKVVFDDGMWEAAKKAIDTAEEYIKDKLLAYADVFIQITAKFSEEGSGGSGGSNNDGSGGATGGATQKATGGYANSGIYQLGEQGYEYVLPHKLTAWIEKMLGGKIQSPAQIEWLISALGRGKEETVNQLALWAGGQKGVYTELPKGIEEWVDRIKVMKNGETAKTGYAEWLWKQGMPAASGSGGGGVGGGSGGDGMGGSGGIDVSGFADAVARFSSAVDRLVGALNGNFNFAMAGGGNTYNVNGAQFNAPNGATLNGLMGQMSKNMRSDAYHGRD